MPVSHQNRCIVLSPNRRYLMWLRLAACAAFLVVPVAYAQTGTAPSSTLSLDDAIARVATTHPDLRIFDGRRQVLDANLASAALKPPMTLGATIENTLGTGRRGASLWSVSVKACDGTTTRTWSTSASEVARSVVARRLSVRGACAGKRCARRGISGPDGPRCVAVRPSMPAACGRRIPAGTRRCPARASPIPPACSPPWPPVRAWRYGEE